MCTVTNPPSRRVRTLSGVLLILLITSVTHPATAQVMNGSLFPQQTTTLTVNVRDNEGEVVPNAQVTLTNEATGAEVLTREANELGVVTFVSLAPGIYTVTVRSPLFKQFTLTNVSVGPQMAVAVDVTLEPIPVTLTSDDVEVSAADEEDTAVREGSLSLLPNFNNDLSPIFQVVPGALPTGPTALGRIVVDGKGLDQSTVYFDGVEVTPLVEVPSGDPLLLNTATNFASTEAAVSKEGLGSPKVRPTSYTPEFGPGTGSFTNGATLAGDANFVTGNPHKNSWKLQLYGDHRNDAFNARNFFDFDGENALRRSRFGGKLGGPIKDDETFLFLSYEGFRGRAERNVYEAVPAEAVGGGVGPLASLMSGYLPHGTVIVPGASANPDFLIARRRVRNRLEANTFDVRLDHLPSPEDRYTLRFTRQGAETILPDGVTGRRQRQRIVFANGVFKMFFSDIKDRKVLQFHDFRFGFNQTRVAVDAEVFTPTDPSLAQSVITTSGTVSTRGLPAGFSAVPVASLGGLIRDVRRGFKLTPFSVSAGYDHFRFVNWRDERDTLRFGGEVRLIRFAFDRFGGLTYSFPNAAALRAGTPGSVTFVSDLSEPGPFGGGSGPRHAAQEYYMGYVTMVSNFGVMPDPLKPTTTSPKTTLTYGVRYDYFGAVRERDDRVAVIDPQTGTLLPRGTRFYRTSPLNFQPRVGLEYKSLILPRDKNGSQRDPNTFAFRTYRVGFGVYTGSPRISDLVLPIESDRFSTGVTGGVFPSDPNEIIRGFVENPETRQFQPLAFARDFKGLERVYKWEASVSETRNGYDFRATYSGNVGTSLPVAKLANKIVNVVTNADPTRPAIVIREFDIVRGGDVFKPFGEFFYRASEGRSSYNALTIAVSRNIKHKSNPSLPRWLGYAAPAFDVSYTISRNVGNASGTLASNPLDLDADFGFNTADARHVFKSSAVINLWQVVGGGTDGKDESRTHPLWGWRVMPIFNVRSGLPLVIRLDRPDVVYVDEAGNVFGSPAAGRRAVINTPGGGASGNSRLPNLISAGYARSSGGLGLLNPEAFSIPAPGAFGNLRRGQLRGPVSVEFNLGLARHLFGDGESHRGWAGDFKVEFFNLINRANFGNPTIVLPNKLGTNTALGEIQPGVPFRRPSELFYGFINSADPGRYVQFTFNLRLKEGFIQ